MGDKLRAGDTLPAISLQMVGGGTVNLPSGIDTDFAIVLFYRGHW